MNIFWLLQEFISGHIHHFQNLCRNEIYTDDVIVVRTTTLLPRVIL